MMTVKIVLNDKGNPPGKLADAELHFDAADSTNAVFIRHCAQQLAEWPGHAGLAARLNEIADSLSSPLAGLKLIGFSIWERRGGNGRNVTFPARQYSVNGERRSFALLRPAADIMSSDGVRDAILAAYAAAAQEASS